MLSSQNFDYITVRLEQRDWATWDAEHSGEHGSWVKGGMTGDSPITKQVKDAATQAEAGNRTEQQASASDVREAATSASLGDEAARNGDDRQASRNYRDAASSLFSSDPLRPGLESASQYHGMKHTMTGMSS